MRAGAAYSLGVRLLDRLAEARERHILTNAKSHLEEGDEVLHWVRVRRPDERREGFAFLTGGRLVVVWTGRPDGAVVVPWPEVRTWGVNPEARGGPIVGVRSAGGDVFFQVPLRTRGAAQKLSDCLRLLDDRVTSPARDVLVTDGFLTDPNVSFEPQPLSPAEKTKRVLVTTLGLVLVLGGLLLTALPGPGLAIVLAGLAILASEYDWAKDALDWAKEKSKAVRAKWQARRSMQ